MVGVKCHGKAPILYVPWPIIVDTSRTSGDKSMSCGSLLISESFLFVICWLKDDSSTVMYRINIVNHCKQFVLVKENLNKAAYSSMYV